MYQVCIVDGKKYLVAKDVARILSNGTTGDTKEALILWKQLSDLAIHCGIFNLRIDDCLSQELCNKIAELLPAEKCEAMKQKLSLIFGEAIECICDNTVYVEYKAVQSISKNVRIIDFPKEEERVTTISDTAKELHISKKHLICTLIRCEFVKYNDLTQTLRPTRFAVQHQLVVYSCGFLVLTHKGRTYIKHSI